MPPGFAKWCYPEVRLFPKLISIGNFYLPTYGVLVATGFLAGLWVTTRLGRRSGLNPELITNLTIYVALAGLLGAKILMLLFDLPQYLQDPGQIFSLSFWQAAGVFQGGLVLAIAFAFFYMKRHGLPLLKTSDAFAPGIALGHAIGRLGCFAAGCCWGQACDRAWAVTFHNPDAYALTGVPLEVPLHPTQLYEFGTEAILFGVLYKLYNRPHEPGRIIGIYLIVSSIARFVIEFYRNHEQALPFGLPLSLTQWIAILVAIGGVAILRIHRAPSGTPQQTRPQTA